MQELIDALTWMKHKRVTLMNVPSCSYDGFLFDALSLRSTAAHWLVLLPQPKKDLGLRPAFVMFPPRWDGFFSRCSSFLP